MYFFFKNAPSETEHLHFQYFIFFSIIRWSIYGTIQIFVVLVKWEIFNVTWPIFILHATISVEYKYLFSIEINHGINQVWFLLSAEIIVEHRAGISRRNGFLIIYYVTVRAAYLEPVSLLIKLRPKKNCCV